MREAYIDLRRAETLKACKCLGVGDLEFWAYEDRGLADVHGVMERMMGLFERYKPELVYCPSPMEIHPDHRAACFLACRAIRDRKG